MYIVRVELGQAPARIGAKSWWGTVTPFAESGYARANIYVEPDAAPETGNGWVHVEASWTSSGREYEVREILWDNARRTSTGIAQPEHISLGERVIESVENICLTDQKRVDRWVEHSVKTNLYLFTPGRPDDPEGVREVRRCLELWLTVLSYESGTSERALADKLWNHGAYLGSAEQLQAVIRATLGAA